MEKKMTKKEMFAQIIAMAKGEKVEILAEEIVAFAEHEIELLAKKSSTSTKTKTQKENEVFVEQVYEALMEVGKPVTVTELMGASEKTACFSNQKLSALLKKLKDSGRIDKKIEGKKTYFFVITEEMGE
jgi:predicted deacylase